jgi:hypothetical protein
MEIGQGPNWGCSAKEKKYPFQMRGILPLFILVYSFVTFINNYLFSRELKALLMQYSH